MRMKSPRGGTSNRTRGGLASQHHANVFSLPPPTEIGMEKGYGDMTKERGEKSNGVQRETLASNGYNLGEIGSCSDPKAVQDESIQKDPNPNPSS